MWGGNIEPYWITPNVYMPHDPAWNDFIIKQSRNKWEWRDWPSIYIEKRGMELMVPLGRERKRQVELVDCLGRKHALKEQQIDLTGPKKTLVLDNYGRLRELSKKDAERILRTRLRDYLDNGDPSPAGPVAPVKKKQEETTKKP